MHTCHLVIVDRYTELVRKSIFIIFSCIPVSCLSRDQTVTIVLYILSYLILLRRSNCLYHSVALWQRTLLTTVRHANFSETSAAASRWMSSFNLSTVRPKHAAHKVDRSNGHDDNWFRTLAIGRCDAVCVAEAMHAKTMMHSKRPALYETSSQIGRTFSQLKAS